MLRMFILWTFLTLLASAAPPVESPTFSAFTITTPETLGSTPISDFTTSDLTDFDEIPTDPNALTDQEHHKLEKRQCDFEGADAFCTDGWVSKSPYASCEEGDYAVFVGREGKVYTICCPDERDGSTKPDEVVGFQCCTNWDFGDCVTAHSIVRCFPGGSDGKQHNLTETEIRGIKCCEGGATINLHRVLAGLGWMAAFWMVCIVLFWDL